MSGIGARRALIPAVGLLILGGAVGARAWAVHEAEQALALVGISWADRSEDWTGATWHQVRGGPMQARSLALQLVPQPRAQLEGAVIELSEAQQLLPSGADQGGQQGPRDASLMPRVDIRDASLTWQGRTLARGLEGTLAPTLSIHGDGLDISRVDGLLVVRGRTELDLAHASGPVEVDVEAGEEVRFTISAPKTTLTHPLIHRAPLAPLHVLLQGTWAPALGGLQAELTVDGVLATITGSLRRDPLAVDVVVQAQDIPFGSALQLFGDAVPEAARAELAGTVGLRAHVSGPPWTTEFTPEAERLGAEGVVPDLDLVAHGPLTWRAPTADGTYMPRTTGPGQEGWVRLGQAGLVPQAIIASEDVGFLSHNGLDLWAVHEALREAADAGIPTTDLRGGSTLTQQLAKNLFLSPERTLSRKAREVLYALELDRRLGKDRVMETYLNVVEFGPDIIGLQAAADAYFLKQPSQLSPREAVFLAAILPAPRTFYRRVYSGGRPPNTKIDQVLDNMVRTGALSQRAAASARRQTLRFVPPAG